MEKHCTLKKKQHARRARARELRRKLKYIRDQAKTGHCGKDIVECAGAHDSLMDKDLSAYNVGSKEEEEGGSSDTILDEETYKALPLSKKHKLDESKESHQQQRTERQQPNVNFEIAQRTWELWHSNYQLGDVRETVTAMKAYEQFSTSPLFNGIV